jgi:Sec-independent protein translocase protein TatA
VALIVLGPERLPKAARQIGKAVAEVRHWSGGIQDEVRNAFNTDVEPDQPPAAPPTTPQAEPPATPVTPPAAGPPRTPYYPDPLTVTPADPPPSDTRGLGHPGPPDGPSPN